MCAIDFDADGRKTQVLPDTLLEKVVEEIAQHRDHVGKVVPYLDCEPLVDQRHDKVRRLKEAGVRTVNIATNASLLSEKRQRS